MGHTVLSCREFCFAVHATAPGYCQHINLTAQLGEALPQGWGIAPVTDGLTTPLLEKNFVQLGAKAVNT